MQGQSAPMFGGTPPGYQPTQAGSNQYFGSNGAVAPMPGNTPQSMDNLPIWSVGPDPYPAPEPTPLPPFTFTDTGGGSGGGSTTGGSGSAPPGYFTGSGSNGYQVPSYGSSASPGYSASGGPLAPGGGSGPGASHNLGNGVITTGPQFPGLSSDFANYIMSQIGGGMTPFNLSTMLPTGGQTQPGQLTAGLNPLLSQLMQFFQNGQGGNMPGMSNLSNIANNGVSALPEWQSMIAAMGQNTQQNQANLKEQFAGMGDLAGSPFGTAMSNYMQQTNLDQNSLLGQLQQSNIQNIQMPAIESLFSGSQQMAGGLQALDQQSIQNMYNEFQRVQPQNNPLMSEMMGLGTLFPPTNKTPTTWENINGTLGSMGSIGGDIVKAEQGSGSGGGGSGSGGGWGSGGDWGGF